MMRFAYRNESRALTHDSSDSDIGPIDRDRELLLSTRILRRRRENGAHVATDAHTGVSATRAGTRSPPDTEKLGAATPNRPVYDVDLRRSLSRLSPPPYQSRFAEL